MEKKSISEKTRKIISEKMKKPVLNTSNGSVYGSLKSVCDECNLNYPLMSMKLSGKKNNNTDFIYIKPIYYTVSQIFTNINGDGFYFEIFFKDSSFDKKAGVRLLKDNSFHILDYEKARKYLDTII